MKNRLNLCFARKEASGGSYLQNVHVVTANDPCDGNSVMGTKKEVRVPQDDKVSEGGLVKVENEAEMVNQELQ